MVRTNVELPIDKCLMFLHVQGYVARPASCSDETFITFHTKYQSVSKKAAGKNALTGINDQHWKRRNGKSLIRFTSYSPLSQTEAFFYNFLLTKVLLLHATAMSQQKCNATLRAQKVHSKSQYTLFCCVQIPFRQETDLLSPGNTSYYKEAFIRGFISTPDDIQELLIDYQAILYPPNTSILSFSSVIILLNPANTTHNCAPRADIQPYKQEYQLLHDQ